MSKDSFHQPANHLGRGHDDEVLMATSTTADQPIDQPVEGEPKTQAEQASTGESPSDEAPEERPSAEEIPLEMPVAEAIPPPAEVAVEPPKRPWWKQLFGSLFGREVEALSVLEAIPRPEVAPEMIAPEVALEEVPEVLEEGPPAEEIPPEVPEAEAVLVPEVAVEPPKRPWWKRLFGSLFGREAEAPPVVEAVPPPEVAPEVTAPEVLPYDRFLAALAEEKVAPRPEVLPEPLPPEEEVPPEAVAPAAPPFTLDDVRELVGEELARMQEDVVRMVQAKPAREQEEQQRALLTAAQAVGDSIYDLKVESVRVELEALEEEQKHMLQDRDRPLRERVEEVDYIRERMAKAEQEITEVVAGTTRRVAEAAQRRAELEGSVVVLGLREEVERQKETIAALEARLGSLPKITVSGGLGLWPTLLALGLIVAVGLAGILLPRQAGPAPTFLVEMATMYQASGETEEAIRILDEAVEAGISDVETLGRVGEVYRLLDEYEKAIAVLKRAVEQEPQEERYRLSLARSYGGAGQHWEAIAQYEALLEINPVNVWYYTEMGHRYRSLRLYDQAIAQYQKVLEIDPKRWQAYHSQGGVYRAMERYDEAIECYQRALEINPDDYWTWVWSGVSYASKNDYAHAIEQYQAAIGIDPDQAGAYYYLGELYLAQGHFDQAVESYQQAIEIYDEYTAAYTGLGKAYVALDNCANAVIQFTKALRLSPNNTEAQRGLEACLEE